VSRIATVDDLTIESSGEINLICTDLTLTSNTNTSIYVGTNNKLLVATASAPAPPIVPTSTLMQLVSDKTARFYLNYSGAGSFGEINISDSSSLGLIISHTRGSQSLIQSEERIRIAANDDIFLFNGLSDTIGLSGGRVSIESANSDLSFTNNLQTVKWPTNTPTDNSYLRINTSSSPYTSEWSPVTTGAVLNVQTSSINLAPNNKFQFSTNNLLVTVPYLSLSSNNLVISEPGIYKITTSFQLGGSTSGFDISTYDENTASPVGEKIIFCLGDNQYSVTYTADLRNLVPPATRSYSIRSLQPPPTPNDFEIKYSQAWLFCERIG